MTQTKTTAPTPKTTKTKPRHLEDDLQKAVMNYLWAQYPKVLAFHVPNGGRRNAREGARLKAQGVMPGVADILILRDRLEREDFHYSGFALELKVKPERQSDSQKTFETRVSAAGWLYRLAYSFDEAKELIDQYLTPSK